MALRVDDDTSELFPQARESRTDQSAAGNVEIGPNSDISATLFDHLSGGRVQKTGKKTPRQAGRKRPRRFNPVCILGQHPGADAVGKCRRSHHISAQRTTMRSCGHFPISAQHQRRQPCIVTETPRVLRQRRKVDRHTKPIDSSRVPGTQAFVHPVASFRKWCMHFVSCVTWGERNEVAQGTANGLKHSATACLPSPVRC